MHFDGRVMNVDDAADPPRHRLAHIVLLGLANAVLFEERRIARIQWDNHPALDDWLRSVGGVVRRAGLRQSQGRRKWSRRGGGGRDCKFRTLLGDGGNHRQQQPGRDRERAVHGSECWPSDLPRQAFFQPFALSPAKAAGVAPYERVRSRLSVPDREFLEKGWLPSEAMLNEATQWQEHDRPFRIF